MAVLLNGAGVPVSVAVMAALAPGAVFAQTPEPIYQGLLKIGQIVDPACTAKTFPDFFTRFEQLYG